MSLRKELIEQVVDDMTLNDLIELAKEVVANGYEDYTDVQIQTEVQEYYPHLINEQESECD